MVFAAALVSLTAVGVLAALTVGALVVFEWVLGACVAVLPVAISAAVLRYRYTARRVLWTTRQRRSPAVRRRMRQPNQHPKEGQYEAPIWMRACTSAAVPGMRMTAASS